MKQQIEKRCTALTMLGGMHGLKQVCTVAAFTVVMTERA